MDGRYSEREVLRLFQSKEISWEENIVGRKCFERKVLWGDDDTEQSAVRESHCGRRAMCRASTPGIRYS